MAQRKRKRSRHRPRQTPAAPETAATPETASVTETAASTTVAERTREDSRAGWPGEPEASRSERRNAQIRAGLIPMGSGERPWPIMVSAVLAGVVGLGNLIAFAAGLKIAGKHPNAGGVVIFSVLMLVCAIGLWRLWYGAVLGFMALLAIIVTVFALLLIEASNLLGLVVALAVIVGAGYLFYKLVRVLSRIQMPRYPGR